MNSAQLKKRIAFGVLFLLQTQLFALSYYSYDFRDANDTINFSAKIDAQSDKLPFNIFDQEWEEVPAHKKSNNAFAQIYSDAYYNYGGFKFGVFGEKIAQISINDGFVELLYNSQKDFFQLLASKEIYKTMAQKPIEGEGNYCDAYGVFVQKVFTVQSAHYLSLKAKLNYANDLHHIRANGYTDSEKFVGSFDYVYSKKNLISKNPTLSESPQGLGYGVDIEYVYNRDKLYFYMGAFNVASYVYWKNVTFMHYDLDSEVIYVGEDGYKHYKPFGVGYYEYGVSFKQKLPQYYRASLNYELFENMAIGNNLKAYENVHSNEPYVNLKIYKGRYKLGYQLENKTLLFGAYYKYVNLEVSNKFGFAGNVLQAGVKISF